MLRGVKLSHTPRQPRLLITPAIIKAVWATPAASDIDYICHVVGSMLSGNFGFMRAEEFTVTSAADFTLPHPSALITSLWIIIRQSIADLFCKGVSIYEGLRARVV